MKNTRIIPCVPGDEDYGCGAAGFVVVVTGHVGAEVERVIHHLDFPGQ